MIHPYGVREVETLLGLPRSTIRSLIAAGFVSPARGPRNAWRFSFQDLIVLRTAQALVAAQVSPRRITKSLRQLRQRLPDSMPLSGLAIGAIANEVVVREGAARWAADSGQYLLVFEGNPADGSLSVIARQQADPEVSARQWFEQAVALERADVDAASHAYEQAIVADPTLVDASINLGRLLHEAKRFTQAESVYRAAVRAGSADPVLLYNLGVLFEDMGRDQDAIRVYEAALRVDARLADGHYNLALLYEKFGKQKEAIRHLARYRSLVNERST